MIILPAIPWFLPLFLYAETHYRFRYFFSYLKKNEPEILADAPHRLEPHQALPLLVIVKDSHRYPYLLHQITVELRQHERTVFRTSLLQTPTKVETQFWWQLFTLDVSQWSGWIDVDVAFTIGKNGRIETYHNDNYRTSSHRPLRTFIADTPLPRVPKLSFGDAHTHSNYTDDQVEFGAPLSASRELSKAMGLSFFCVTDHSYDLDDCLDNYLINDPLLPKWKMLQREVESLNSNQADFVIVRGEEVSCRNSDGRNVHLLLFGERTFLPGSGDSAEKWLRTRSEHSITEILELKDPESVPYAAHPSERIPLLQRLLLERGIWSERDLSHDAIAGIQFANGARDEGFQRGYRKWIRILLTGKKIFALGGTDAHGNFNRFRQLGVPFFRIKEMPHQIFGKMRTGVFINDEISEQKILTALSKGRSIITDGPVVDAYLETQEQKRIFIGETLRGPKADLHLHAVSTVEFGELVSVKVFLGVVGESEEKLLCTLGENLGYRVSRKIPINAPRPCYTRIEVSTSSQNTFDGAAHFCFTNPIWITPPGGLV